MKVTIKATVDFEKLLTLVRAAPMLGSASPVVEFDCGRFSCDTIEEVWAMAREYVAYDARQSYEKLRDFAP
jgi:hypothetical protein